MRGVLFALAFATCALPAWGDDVPPPVSIALIGAIQNPGSVTKEELSHLPPVTVDVSQETDKGPATGKYVGALLWTVIQNAALANGSDKNAYLRHTILVTGADGYAAAFAEGEIDPKLEGKQIIIAYMKDGVLIDGLRLVVPGDTHASRSVRDIATIEVK
jgi:hypothetical protein